MARDLGSLRLSLDHFLDRSSVERLQHAAGQAAKEAALNEAARDLGGDRSFSGMRRRQSLGAGYDTGPDGAFINLRPKGLWILADWGRKRLPPQGKVYASLSPTGRKRRKGTNFASALNTPWGPRFSVRASTWGGHQTRFRAEVRWETEVPEAIEDDLAKQIREVF